MTRTAHFPSGAYSGCAIGLAWIMPVMNGVDIMIFFGQDEAVSRHSEQFLFYAAFGLLPSFIFMVMRFYTSSFQRPVPQMMAAILGLGLNIVLNFIFAKVDYGMPEMGLAGYCPCDQPQPSGNAICLGLFIQLKTPFRNVQPFRRWWIADMPIARRIVRLGPKVCWYWQKQACLSWQVL